MIPPKKELILIYISCLIQLLKLRQKSYAQKKGTVGPNAEMSFGSREEEPLLLAELLPVPAKSYHKTMIWFVPKKA